MVCEPVVVLLHFSVQHIRSAFPASDTPVSPGTDLGCAAGKVMKDHRMHSTSHNLLLVVSKISCCNSVLDLNCQHIVKKAVS